MDDSMSLRDYAKSIRSSSSRSLWNYGRTLLSVLETSDEQADGSSHLGMSQLHYDKSLRSSSFPLARNGVGILPPVLESSDEKADGSSHLGMSLVDHVKWFRSSFPSARNDVRISPPVLESSDEQADGSSHPGYFSFRKGSYVPVPASASSDAHSPSHPGMSLLDYDVHRSPSSRFFFFNRRFDATSDKENRKNSMASHREYAQENFFLECRKSIRLLGALAASVTYQAGLNPPGGFQSGTESERIRCQGSNKQFKEETTSWTLFSCKLAIALFHSLPVALFEALGIPLQAKAAAGTWMVAIALLCILLNLFDAIKYYFRAFGHMVHNVVAEAAPTWELWSGSTHHATGNRAFLQNYETVDGLIIQLGDGMCMPVTGRGTVVMDTMVLPDVWFVPDLKSNIVSVSQLAELDCNIVFKRDACYISSATDGSIIGKALLKENSMFKLEFLKVPLDN